MRVLVAEGSPFQVGRALGAAAPELVRRAVAAVCRFELDEDDLDRRLERIEERLAGVFPEALAEAEGLAEGAGISRRDALALSVASDIHGQLPGWCSLLAVPAENGLLVGKNLDTTHELGELQVVQRICRDGAHPFAHLTCAGAMWTDGGVNDAGLALVNSSLAAAGTDPDGLPDGILAREILARCADVPSAVALAEEHGVMTLGETLLLADRDGRAAIVETLPGGRSVRASHGLIACNHPLEHRLTALAARDDPIRANSRRRLERLETEAGRDSTWTFRDVADVLGHADVFQSGDAGLHTVASLIVSPRERCLWATRAPPADERGWALIPTPTPAGSDEAHAATNTTRTP